MKKIVYLGFVALLGTAVLGFTSCNPKNEKEESTEVTTISDESETTPTDETAQPADETAQPADETTDVATEEITTTEQDLATPDINSLLAQYEKLTISLEDLSQKAKAKESGALEKYNEVLGNVQGVQKELDRYKGDMTVEQSKKFASLVARSTKASAAAAKATVENVKDAAKKIEDFGKKLK